MKIAILSDTHLGYARFEKDSFDQAESAITNAGEKADFIIHAGDIFDIKIPKLETINKALSIFKKSKIPIYAIHGNHERRSKDLVNPAQLLETGELITYLHGSEKVIEKNGEKVQLFGMGNVPEDYANEALKRALEKFVPLQDAFKILILHQSIKELMPNGENEISLDELEKLLVDKKFDLVINGHIHQRVIRLNGKFLIPGSTVVTQLKKDETAPRGYFLYDTQKKSHEFVEIPCRKFYFEELNFSDASIADVKNSVEEKIRQLRKNYSDAIIRIVARGTLKEGVGSADMAFAHDEATYVDNCLNAADLKEKLTRIIKTREEKISVKEVALKELKERINGKITLFDEVELFEKLVEGSEETLEYLNKK